MGTEKKPAKTKQRQSIGHSDKYKRQADRTERNKRSKAAARKRWLDKRQSPEVRERMSLAWYTRHTPACDQRTIVVQRYGYATPITPKHEKPVLSQPIHVPDFGG